uniref:Reverse transcriptase domain-containing protein n=1 Tax=Chloebia gouldiae TaxID=44316 RepID=A0A3L8QVT9_CHLGU|nr:hypothetical protein DV515_00017357 [Chloebia gouldiae]
MLSFASFSMKPARKFLHLNGRTPKLDRGTSSPVCITTGIQELKNFPTIFGEQLAKDLESWEPPPGEGQLLQYVDDLIATQTQETCVDWTVSLLNFLGLQGYRVSQKKAQMWRQTVIYLGYEVSAGQRTLGQDRKEAICQTPRPQTAKELRTFLGMMGWGMGEPVIYDCLETIEDTYSSCPDLKDIPLEGAEIWFTDGSSYVISGKRHAGYVVTTSRENRTRTTPPTQKKAATTPRPFIPEEQPTVATITRIGPYAIKKTGIQRLLVSPEWSLKRVEMGIQKPGREGGREEGGGTREPSPTSASPNLPSSSSALGKTVIEVGVSPPTPKSKEPPRLYPPLPSSDSEWDESEPSPKSSPQVPIESRSRRQTRMNPPPQTTRKQTKGVIQAPLRQAIASDGEPRIIKIPFFSRDLEAWEKTAKGYWNDPTGVAKRLHFMVKQHLPDWADMQLLLDALTETEKQLVLKVAKNLAEEACISTQVDSKEVFPLQDPM